MKNIIITLCLFASGAIYGQTIYVENNSGLNLHFWNYTEHDCASGNSFSLHNSIVIPSTGTTVYSAFSFQPISADIFDPAVGSTPSTNQIGIVQTTIGCRTGNNSSVFDDAFGITHSVTWIDLGGGNVRIIIN